MTKKTCFMIQPFSEPYNKRFENIYQPAIEHVGLIPYRAGGPSAEIITEDIEDGIRNAHICFADITENNPNVWYEVGFAYACYKRVVMVCNKAARDGKKLPFDISVKNVIPYNDLVDSYELNSSKFAQEIIKQARERAKKADSDIVASPVTVQQPKNSDNSLTLFDRKVLEMICDYDTEHGRSISRGDITSQFFGAERKVLASLYKMREARYISKYVDYDDDTMSTYSPDEKGFQWYYENDG